MQRWEYCDVTWQPEQVTLTMCQAAGPKLKSFSTESWPQVLAKLGQDGWELVSAISSPLPIQEYFFYFKRPVDG